MNEPASNPLEFDEMREVFYKLLDEKRELRDRFIGSLMLLVYDEIISYDRARELIGLGMMEWRAEVRRVVGMATEPTDAEAFDLIAHLHRQREFSLRAFGPGNRWRGVLDHIRKELDEIANDPADLSEWIDVVLLAFDGAWRQGHSPEQIADALQAKLAKNEARTWPDWRTQPTDRAIEHVREEAKP